MFGSKMGKNKNMTSNIDKNKQKTTLKWLIQVERWTENLNKYQINLLLAVVIQEFSFIDLGNVLFTDYLRLTGTVSGVELEKTLQLRK